MCAAEYAPELPVSPVTQKSSQKTSLSQLRKGLASGFRFNQTLLKVYPQLFRCLRERRQPSAVEMRQLFESLGVTYIKLGQFIASSPSIFPAEYVTAFQSCLDDTPAVPFSHIKRVLASELDRPIDEIFNYIDPQPLASASIAQVHAATLRNGDEVVIKVQKPQVDQVIETDMQIALLVGKLVEWVAPALGEESVTGIIEEIHQSMARECDFCQEADNLLQFNAFLERSDITTVIAPKPVMDASSKRVLTMERIHGVALTEEGMDAMPVDDAAPVSEDGTVAPTPRESLFNALNVWFASLTQCEFFHADLHSGNLLLKDDGQVAFIDFGMVGRITPEIWRAAFQLFMAIGENDFDAMAHAMTTIGMTNRKVSATALASDLEGLFSASFDQYQTEFGANEQLMTISQVAKDHGLRFPSAFTMIIKQLLYFDRYLQLLAPGTELFDSEEIDTHGVDNF